MIRSFNFILSAAGQRWNVLKIGSLERCSSCSRQDRLEGDKASQKGTTVVWRRHDGNVEKQWGPEISKKGQ